MSKIIIVDDDPAMNLLAEGLTYRGHEVKMCSSPSDALQNRAALADADVVILDILMPWEDESTSITQTPGPSGMKILKELRKLNSQLPVIALSAIQDATVIEALKDDPCTTFISKWDSHPIRDMIKIINERLGIKQDTPPARPFIVHGRDDKTKLAIKNYLQNILHLPEPIILHEAPSLGRTIIEKFEETSAASDLVFVLLTPDDQGGVAGESNDQKRRARQNVIFEMGYFIGTLGRRSGRVLLLHIGPLELPSDLAGVVYIDITHGIESAGETIRKELAHVLPNS